MTATMTLATTTTLALLMAPPECIWTVFFFTRTRAMAPSRSFTLFQGRVVTGPYGGGLGMSLVLLVGPTVVFFVFT